MASAQDAAPDSSVDDGAANEAEADDSVVEGEVPSEEEADPTSEDESEVETDEAPIVEDESNDDVDPVDTAALAASGEEADAPVESSAAALTEPASSDARDTIADSTSVETAVDATDAAGDEDGTTALERAMGEGSDGWYASGDLGTALGLGTFVADPGARNPYLDWSLGVSPGYRFSDGTTVSARLAATQELTNSDGADSAHQVLLSDTWLTASRSIVTIPWDLDIGVRGTARLYLPTSLRSQHETLVVGALASIGLTRSFGPVTFALSTGFRKNFHRYASPTLDSEGSDLRSAFARDGGAERIDAFVTSTGGNNVSYQFRNSLSVIYSPFDEWSFTASYLIANAFTYNSFPRDGLASEYADDGRGQRDAYAATLDASWALEEHLTLSAGILTQGSPRQSDNSGFRFPFFDFESEAENLTVFYLSATATVDESDFSAE